MDDEAAAKFLGWPPYFIPRLPRAGHLKLLGKPGQKRTQAVCVGGTGANEPRPGLAGQGDPARGPVGERGERNRVGGVAWNLNVLPHHRTYGTESGRWILRGPPNLDTLPRCACFLSSTNC